jgi:hypothetical protein
VSEAFGTATVEVVLTVAGDGTLASAVSVDVVDLLTGSATGGGVDYTYDSPTTVTFSAGSGSSTQSVNLTVVNDALVEPDQDVDLALADLVDPTGQVSMIAPQTHELTIIDDDAVSSTPEVEEIIYFNQHTDLEKNYSPDNTGQRSIIRQIRITFTGPVTVPLGPVTDNSFVLESTDTATLGTRVGLEVLSSQLVGGKQVVVLGFTGTDLIEDISEGVLGVRPMLEDGNYRLTVDGSALGIDANGSDPGVDAIDDFFRLFGDANGDRNVDVSDAREFIRVYFRSGILDELFDFDHDAELMDIDDLSAFLARFARRRRPPR